MAFAIKATSMPSATIPITIKAMVLVELNISKKITPNIMVAPKLLKDLMVNVLRVNILILTNYWNRQL